MSNIQKVIRTAKKTRSDKGGKHNRSQYQSGTKLKFRNNKNGTIGIKNVREPQVYERH